ncbi:hypothetical protein L596_027144 [Steinernema carpocapsae]|uniref:Uncharacterized protein n=1 Tax=Steinernema carpocapsae TaxID=34508 RepID=A0A4U5M3G6_STECR|nr:hypothetical protein L596_027144 [Steinernema carpocapsae]
MGLGDRHGIQRICATRPPHLLQRCRRRPSLENRPHAGEEGARRRPVAEGYESPQLQVLEGSAKNANEDMTRDASTYSKKFARITEEPAQVLLGSTEEAIIEPPSRQSFEANDIAPTSRSERCSAVSDPKSEAMESDESPQRLRRSHFSEAEDDRLWEIVLTQVKKAPAEDRLPTLLNPFSGTFWREAKNAYVDLTRSVSTYSKKFARMWKREEFDRLPLEDLIFLRERLANCYTEGPAQVLLGSTEEANIEPPRRKVTSVLMGLKPKKPASSQASCPAPLQLRADTPPPVLKRQEPEPEPPVEVPKDRKRKGECKPKLQCPEPENPLVGVPRRPPLLLTEILNQQLEARAPELMRRWTVSCAAMNAFIEKVLAEEREKLKQRQQAQDDEDFVPSPKVRRKRTKFATEEERQAHHRERMRVYNQKRKEKRQEAAAMSTKAA